LDDGELLLDAWLDQAGGRTTTPSQRSEILDAFGACPSPLFLRISFELARHWHSHDEPAVTSLPREFKTVGEGIPALMSSVFENLRIKHGAVFVDQALGLLTVARTGISSVELEDVLSLNDDVLNEIFGWTSPPVRRMPHLFWVRLLHDIRPFLVERGGDGGVPLWSWAHTEWQKAAITAFVDSGIQEGGGAVSSSSSSSSSSGLHGQLAEYFAGVWVGTPKPFRSDKGGRNGEADRHVQPQPLLLSGTLESNHYKCNTRKLRLLPYHAARGGLWKLWVEVLTDLNFIAAKCAMEDGVQDLLQDYAMKRDLPDDLEVNTATGQVQMQK
jgi:hypothetical protein